MRIYNDYFLTKIVIVLALFKIALSSCDFQSDNYLDPLDNICKPCPINTISKESYCICDQYSYSEYYIPS